ncbi:unnamed protein product [Brassica oleracea var. botrytis]
MEDAIAAASATVEAAATKDRSSGGYDGYGGGGYGDGKREGRYKRLVDTMVVDVVIRKGINSIKKLIIGLCYMSYVGALSSYMSYVFVTCAHCLYSGPAVGHVNQVPAEEFERLYLSPDGSLSTAQPRILSSSSSLPSTTQSSSSLYPLAHPGFEAKHDYNVWFEGSPISKHKPSASAFHPSSKPNPFDSDDDLGDHNKHTLKPSNKICVHQGIWKFVQTRLNGGKLLEMIRGRRLAFVGDSLNRNMWESLVCILKGSVKVKSQVFEAHGRHQFRWEAEYSFVFKVSFFQQSTICFITC